MPAYPAERAEQSRRHLAIANEVRLARAALRRDVEAGARGWLEALDHELVQTVELRRFLLWLPKCGKAKARRIVRAVDANDATPVGELGARRRALLEAELRSAVTNREATR